MYHHSFWIHKEYTVTAIRRQVNITRWNAWVLGSAQMATHSLHYCSCGRLTAHSDIKKVIYHRLVYHGFQFPEPSEYAMNISRTYRVSSNMEYIPANISILFSCVGFICLLLSSYSTFVVRFKEKNESRNIVISGYCQYQVIDFCRMSQNGRKLKYCPITFPSTCPVLSTH